MLTETLEPALSGERILRGEHGWWYLGPGGIAKLQAGHLTPAGELTQAACAFLDRAGLRAVSAPEAYSLTVLPTTSCNLGCGYCFQNSGPDPAAGPRPARIRASRMTPAAIPSLLAFAERQMKAAGLKRLGLTLFGGNLCSTRIPAWSC